MSAPNDSAGSSTCAHSITKREGRFKPNSFAAGQRVPVTQRKLGIAMCNFNRSTARLFAFGLAVLAGLLVHAPSRAATTLSDNPVFSASNVPANLMLALSVEFPTGTVAAYTDSNGFVRTNTYLGYFDPAKCYSYQVDAGTPDNNYFVPTGAVPLLGCGLTQWSGNLLNWVSMTAIDEFRQTLSGGNRKIDTAVLTVLQRARQTGQGSGGNFPTKSFSGPVGLVPASIAITGTVYVRSRNSSGGEITANGDNGVFIEVANNNNFINAGANRSVVYYARVKVCDPVAGLESNCTQYGSGYKPEGLIQKNADRIRVGAAGYLNRDGNSRPNGVLRSSVRDVGPTKYNGFSTRTTNPFREWDPGTGVFVANPDVASALSSAVPNSGAINYLNKFGTAQPYMTYDTISELYWAALAHLMNVPLDGSYTGGLTAGAAAYDAFPAISTTAVDPIQYSCQGNAIVVIGDSHTWCDSRVPSSGPNSSGSNGCSNQAPLAPVQGLDAQASANALGQLPLLEANSNNTYSATAPVYLPTSGGYRTALGTTFATTGAGSATYGIAGMAYFAHTKDIRPDNASVIATTDKQTVDTFVVDVMEPGAADNASSSNATFDPNNLGSRGPNQYWLAAKYGGFDDVNNDGKPANYLTWHTNTTQGTNTRPDNLFPGNRPDLIQSGLATIFNRIASKKILSAVGPGVTATRSLSSADMAIYRTSAVGFPVYTTKYKPGDWTGDVIGSISVLAADGTVNPVTNAASPPLAVQWSAQSRLDQMTQVPDTSSPPKPVGWDTTRRIVTMNDASNTGVAFRYANLSSGQKAALNSDTNLVNYFRGDRSRENINYRARRSVLGDIVNSEAVLVQAASSPNYSDATNPGYSTFRTSQASRAPVIYVGSNDGMLHAFASDFSAPTPLGTPSSPADVSNGGGSELFAYVPSFVYKGPNNTPNIDGLAALSNLAGVTDNGYSHHFYVDQTPQVSDADFNRVAGNPTGIGSPDWHTLLVGSLGKGGRGVYALDVTTVPAGLSAGSSAAQEAAIRSKVLWEFTTADLGYVYGKPNIAKTRKYGWVVLVTTGYNNASGVGRLYVLNAKTGALLETVSTTGGSAADPQGLGRMGAYTQDFSDNTIEQVYAGDLKGNLWRFDLSAASGAYTVTKFATLTAPDGTAQPITVAPRVETDIDLTGLNTRRWVFVGTGQFLDVSDLSSTQVQSMYGLRDGTATLPSCVDATAIPNICVSNSNSLPLQRTGTGLVPIPDLLAGVNVPDTAGGWNYDLPGRAGNAPGGASERIIIDPDSQAGVPIIAWATLVPTDDPCAYQGAIYAVNYATGRTALLDLGGNPIVSVAPPGGAPTKVAIQQLPDGSLGLLYGSLGGIPSIQKLDALGLTPALSRTNWREILN